jgi:hypothetical protein
VLDFLGQFGHFGGVVGGHGRSSYERDGLRILVAPMADGRCGGEHRRTGFLRPVNHAGKREKPAFGRQYNQAFTASNFHCVDF